MKSSAHITGLYLGKAVALAPEGQRSAIYKKNIHHVDVDTMGIIGDQQADLRVHGGLDKALHHFSARHYASICAHYPELKQHVVPGSMGENISCNGLDEHGVYLGDIWRLGTVDVQVSQPRTLCWKVNHRFDQDDLARFITKNRANGWYYRVLTTGNIQVGDRITLVKRFTNSVSIDHYLRTVHQHRPKQKDLEILANCPGLTAALREKIDQRRHYLYG